jgi:hypothetical protein
MHEDIISWSEMCARENGRMLQAGMHYRSGGTYSVLLMSTRPNAPYPDAFEEDGTVLLYIGHDAPGRAGVDAKAADQPRLTPRGKLTQNGRFYDAAMAYKEGRRPAEHVRVYEKLRDGVWADNGWFLLEDAEIADVGGRKIFRFRLVAVADPGEAVAEVGDGERRRMIPSKVKQEVWRRDKGKCVLCGNNENLHFDHIIPYVLGGASDTAENVQLLCGKHNLQKGAKIV